MKYLLLTLLFMGLTGVFVWVDNDEKHPTINEIAVKPDELLEYASETIRKNYYGTSVVQIQKAIKAMKLIKRDTDSTSDIVIEKAIFELEIISKEIANDRIDKDQIYETFVNALNALAYAQLRISRKYVKTDELEEAAYAMNHAIHHLETARHFAKGKRKYREEEVYIKIDSLLNTDLNDKELFINELNRIILEIDTGSLKEVH